MVDNKKKMIIKSEKREKKRKNNSKMVVRGRSIFNIQRIRKEKLEEYKKQINESTNNTKIF